ncbi:MAG TPA: AAA family ATPase [Vicinamibacterales bacterium]|nr:AAA family ATPase [Vicinamibacterales bacterium]
MSTRPLSYEPFFGLKQKPFSLAPDPEFLYESPTHAVALEALLAGIRRREGLLALTGDVGTGKTTICRALLRNLDQTTFSAFVPDPFASREDLLKMLLIDFGVAKIQDFTTGPLAHARRTELSYLLSSFLQTLMPLDAFVVVFIDEAQKMSPSLIEEVRILSDAFTPQGQLQIVFVGQLELMDTLKSPGLRQVDQRVSVYCKLEPLAPGDVEGYVNHRLQVAGGPPDRPTFAPGALALLHAASGGVPRLMNRLCDRALHEAYVRRSPMVDRDLLASVLDGAPQPAALRIPVIEPQPAPRRAVIEPQPPAPRTPVVGVPPPVRTTGPSFATQVDVWLAEVDRGPASVASIPALEEPVWPDETVATATTFAAFPHDERHVHRRPYSYIERMGRRWARAALIATAALVGLKVIVSAAAYVPAQFARAFEPPTQAVLPSSPLPDVRPVMLPAPAAFEMPPPAPAENHVIAVAVFTTAERSRRVLETLERQGFQAFIRTAVRDGQVLYRILIGPFDSHHVATADLQRLRRAGGYDDAHLMPR